MRCYVHAQQAACDVGFDTVDRRNSKTIQGRSGKTTGPNVTWAAVTNDTVASHFVVGAPRSFVPRLAACRTRPTDVSDGRNLHVHGVGNITNISGRWLATDAPVIKSGAPFASDNDLIKQQFKGARYGARRRDPPSFRSWPKRNLHRLCVHSGSSQLAMIVGSGVRGPVNTGSCATHGVSRGVKEGT